MHVLLWVVLRKYNAISLQKVIRYTGGGHVHLSGWLEYLTSGDPQTLPCSAAVIAAHSVGMVSISSPGCEFPIAQLGT